ncbi:MAG: hypothetical protein ACRC4W_03460 [Treponemataceae bacterium]
MIFFSTCQLFTDPSTFEQSTIYMGLISFSGDIKTFPLTNNLYSTKSTINSLSLGENATALCYAVDKGSRDLENAKNASDYRYLVTFTDGIDNSSSSLYQKYDGHSVEAGKATYDKAQENISKAKLDGSFVIAYGSEAVKDTANIQKLTYDPVKLGSTDKLPFYQGFEKADGIKPAFNQIQSSIREKSNKILLKINESNFSNKLYELHITVKGVPDPIKLRFRLTHNLGTNDPKFSVDEPSDPIGFDIKKIHATVEDRKIVISLTDISYKGSKRVIINDVKLYGVSGNSGRNLILDVENEVIANATPKVSLMLILDTSSSIAGDFEYVKQVATDFVQEVGAWQ